MADDLFASTARPGADYDAHSIEVLEGIKPVRRWSEGSAAPMVA
jgi:hypothetical protein